MKLYKSIILVLIFLVIMLSSCVQNGLESQKNSSNSYKESIESSLQIESSSSISSTINYNSFIYAAPNGSGDGSYQNPYSIKTAITKISTETTLYLFSGTYYLNEVIVLNKSGSNNNYINIFSLDDEDVILDFGKDYSKEQQITNGYGKQANKGIVVRGSYYHIKGITITNCGSTGMHIYGNNNIVENCVFRKNGNTGLNVAGSSEDTIDKWPSYNLIKNCTSYGNYDWDRSEETKGEDADGFGAKLCCGYGNVFDGCIAYNNSDDGWDLFTKIKTGPIGPVVIKNCVAFNNGYSINFEEQKNGNGFKLGGRAIEVSHFVENCVAFNNKANGFDDNSNPGTLTISNCTSYANGKQNFATGRFLEKVNIYKSTWYEGTDLFGPIYNVPGSHNVYYNCLSYLGVNGDSYSGEASNCYFYLDDAYSVFSSKRTCNSKYAKGNYLKGEIPFVSTTFEFDLENIHKLYRNLDGSVNLKDFLKCNEKFQSLNIGAKF